MDKEVLRETWQGTLPMCFKLHADDVDGMQHPEPYYIMVPRITYFPIVLDRVAKYFNRFVDPSKHKNEDMWLDYDGQPIKWQHPIGLSWDLLGTGYDLPWRLIIHFSDFPSKDLVRCNNKASIKTNFMSTVKEADNLKHKGSVVRNMLEKDQNLLWSSLVDHKFDQFWSVNKRLMERVDDELFKSIPFRIYFLDYTYIQKIIRPCTTEKSIFYNSSAAHKNEKPSRMSTIYDTDIVIVGKSTQQHQCSIEGLENNQRFTTMLDLIQVTFKDRLEELLLPRRFKSDSTSSSAGCEPAASQDTSITSDSPIDVRLFKYRFLLHGVEVPFDTPLQWLSENMSYPDNFLHICAVIKT